MNAMMCTHLLIAILLIAVYPSSAAAELVRTDLANSGDGFIVRDTETSLEWLNLTRTNNLTYEEVNAQLHENGRFHGFRYATRLEVYELIRHAEVPVVPGATASNFLPLHSFISMIYVSPPPVESFVTAESTTTAIQFRISGVVADTTFDVGFHDSIGLQVQSGVPSFPENVGNIGQGAIRDTGRNAGFSHFLVRSVETVPAPPPIPFAGFFPPLENDPVLNSVRGGSTVPVKFSLGGDFGMDIFAPGFPVSRPVTCDSFTVVGSVDETEGPGQSQLAYDSIADRYILLWKTESEWRNGCRQLLIKLHDGSTHIANFRFR
jgi:hypothetical protein